MQAQIYSHMIWAYLNAMSGYISKVGLMGDDGNIIPNSGTPLELSVEWDVHEPALDGDPTFHRSWEEYSDVLLCPDGARDFPAVTEETTVVGIGLFTVNGNTGADLLAVSKKFTAPIILQSGNFIRLPDQYPLRISFTPHGGDILEPAP